MKGEEKMSGIDWSEIENGHQGNAVIKTSEKAVKQMGNNSISILNKELDSVAIGGIKTKGCTAAAAIPVVSIVEIATRALNIFDHAIQVYGQITVEKEHTKQVQAMAYAQKTLAREQTKQEEIQARERTAAIVTQAKSEYESKRIELEKYLSELKNEQDEREMSQEKWRSYFPMISKWVNSLSVMIDDIWQQMKKSNFADDNLMQQISDLRRERSELVEKLSPLLER